MLILMILLADTHARIHESSCWSQKSLSLATGHLANSVVGSKKLIPDVLLSISLLLKSYSGNKLMSQMELSGFSLFTDDPSEIVL